MNSEPEVHSRFAPSSAGRWVVCQESLRPLPADHYVRDDTDDQYARDGNAKHALSAWSLTNGNDPVDALLMEMQFHGLTITTDIIEAVSIYIDAVQEFRKSDPTLYYEWFEERVNIEDVHEDMYGTLDCALYSETNEHLIIGDAKFGWEIIEVDGNWQIRSYAIGKVRELEELGFTVKTITCFICQPVDAYEPLKKITYSRNDLRKFAQILKKATKGNAVKAGDHCKRCPRAHCCETLDAWVMDIAGEVMEHKPSEFNRLVTAKSGEEVARILDRQGAFKAWFSAISAWGKQLIILGDGVPGWQTAQSLSNRAYKDHNEAEKVLLARFGDGIYEPRTLRSPAQIEKVFPEAKLLMEGTCDQPGLCERYRGALKLKRKT